MPDQVIGSRGSAPSPPPVSGRVLALVALGAVALGYLLGSYQQAAVPTHRTTPTTTPPPLLESTPSTRAAPAVPLAGTESLRRLVPGVESRLFTVLVGRGRMELATWFPHAPAASRTIPPQYASGPDLDADRGWGAVVIRGTDGPLLHLFRPDWRTPGTLVPDSSGVTSFAWHPNRPARLAWMAAPPGGETTLRIADARSLASLSEPPEAVATVPTGWRLEAWAEWGFLVSGPGDGGTVRTLTPDGELLAERIGVETVAAGPDGRLLLARTGPEERDIVTWMWSDPTLGRLGPAGFGPVPFAWHGERVVALEERTSQRLTFRTIEAGTGRTLDRLSVEAGPFPTDLLPLGWTFDDFLVAASAYGSTLVFVDLEDGSVHRMNVDGSVWGFWVDESPPP